ncbi:hypothetical protein MLD38_024885 [Melastoma candidum]|uniref:Uncharacterized protein n=1 Tax=Melastoma candidum TaxID=119954 RepID=A0ACB9NUM4_9MYRT|nr:hypothetical protein MLD38_024885 [Melastoma candidum]
MSTPGAISASASASPLPTTVKWLASKKTSPRVCCIPARSRRSSSPRYEQSVVAKAEAHFRKEMPLSLGKVSRRLLVGFGGLIPSIACIFPGLALPPMFDMREPEVIRTVKLADGVRIQDIVEGTGAEAHEGDLVQLNYVCRRSNGYFVHSTVDQFSGESTPVTLPLDESLIIRGLKEVLLGMRVGGKRRALIPPSAGYVDENLQPIPDEFGPRRSLLSHVKEPLIFEVQLLKVL